MYIYFVANNSNIYLQSKKYELVRIQISKALSILSKNKRWFTKNNKSIFVEFPPDDSWENIRYNPVNKGKIIISNVATLNILFIDKADKIPDGWVKGNLSKRNTMIITSPDKLISRQISKDCAIPEGWSKSAPKSKTWRIINDLGDEQYIKNKTEIPIGWMLEGKSKNMVHYYDPLTLKCSKFLNESEVPFGWVKGGANQFGVYRTRNRKWYFDPNTNKSKMFYPDTQPTNWLPGRHAKNLTDNV